MKTALIIVFSNLKNDARVIRQVNWVKKNFRTTVICFDALPQNDAEIIKIKQTKLTLLRKLFLGMALILRWNSLAYKLFHNYGFLKLKLKGHQFDLIIANDIDALPLALSLKNRSKIIFDAHEYAPRHFENNKMWRFFFQPFYQSLCSEFIPKVDGMLTVGEGLANEYEKNYKVKPVIITNATSYSSIPPSETNEHKIRLIHHGIANQSRRLELMIEMMEHLDHRFTLDMILMTSDYASPATKAYISSLHVKLQSNSRIRILPGVPSAEVVRTIHTYDIGVFLIPPVNFNYANTLPNKLFDFIQARLGVAIGPTPEMANIVKKYRIGVVADDFTPKKLAEKLQLLSLSDVKSFKANADNAALELNAEKNEVIFNLLINKLLPN